jgi:Tfp pilus assembly protein PilV
MKRRGFTLVEVVVAGLVMVLVLGVLAMALRYFFRGSRNLEMRSDALTLAALEAQEIRAMQPLPEPFTAQREDTIMGRGYSVRTSLTWTGDHTRLLSVRVFRGDSISVELSREFSIRSQEARP